MELLNFKSTKDFGELEGYVLNKEKVLNILKGLNFTVKQIGFADGQYNYIISIIKNNIKQDFDYFEGSGWYNNQEQYYSLSQKELKEKIINLLYCLTLDYNCSGDTLEEFLDMYGYTDRIEGRKIYNKVQKNNKKLITLFNKKELNTLADNLDL